MAMLAPGSFILWLAALLRRENMIAAAGSLKRRLLGRDYLEMEAGLEGRSAPAPLPLGISIGGYEERYEPDCISLLNNVASLGWWTPETFRTRLLSSVREPGKDIFVMSGSGAVKGIAAIHEEGRPVPEIGFVAVSPQERGQGLGLTMMNHVLDEAARRGFKAACVRTDSFRIAAISIYLRCGFRPRPRNAVEDARWQMVLQKVRERTP